MARNVPYEVRIDGFVAEIQHSMPGTGDLKFGVRCPCEPACATILEILLPACFIASPEAAAELELRLQHLIDTHNARAKGK